MYVLNVLKFIDFVTAWLARIMFTCRFVILFLAVHNHVLCILLERLQQAKLIEFLRFFALNVIIREGENWGTLRVVCFRYTRLVGCVPVSMSVNVLCVFLYECPVCLSVRISYVLCLSGCWCVRLWMLCMFLWIMCVYVCEWLCVSVDFVCVCLGV